MSLLARQSTPEYMRDVRRLAMDMMSVAQGRPRDIIPGALAIAVAVTLMQMADGEDDVEAFAERVRMAIVDTKASMAGRALS